MALASFTTSCLLVRFVRGAVPNPGKKLLWGGGKADCDVRGYGKGATDAPGATRIWFLREESTYLRPVVDAYGVYFVGFTSAWPAADNADLAKTFAHLLLTPAAMNKSARDYGRTWDFELPSTACFLLGRTECIEQMRALAMLGDPLLRRHACEFLNSQFREACTP